MTNNYEAIEPVSTNDMQVILRRNDVDELLLAVLGVALYHDELSFAEETCVKLAMHEHFNVRGNAILGLGHLARRFRYLNEARVKPIIEAALNDVSEYVRGQAWAASDDIVHFLGWHIEGFE